MNYDNIADNSAKFIAAAQRKLVVAKLDANIATTQANIAAAELEQANELGKAGEMQLSIAMKFIANIETHKATLKQLKKLKQELFPKRRSRYTEDNIYEVEEAPVVAVPEDTQAVEFLLEELRKFSSNTFANSIGMQVAGIIADFVRSQIPIRTAIENIVEISRGPSH